MTDNTMTDNTHAEDFSSSPGCLLEHSPDAVLIVGRDGRILQVNEHALELFGYTAEALVGQPIEVLVPDTMRAAHNAMREYYAVTPHLRPMGSGLAITGQHSDGREIPVDVMLSPESDQRVVVVIRDVSHIHALQQETAAQAERLAQLNEAKDYLLGMAAHDLRNPLTVIRGYSAMLKDGLIGDLSDDQREVMAHIERSSEYMAALVDDLLDYAALESGLLRLRAQPTDVAKLAAEVVALERTVASNKGSAITLEADPAALEADPHKLRQVMHNLISNAVKYAPPAATTRVRVFQEGPQVAFAVIDSGPGLSRLDQDGIFEPFRRAQARPTAGESSTGLGLAIARKIMEAHGGTLSVESELGQGCTFTAHLPLPASR